MYDLVQALATDDSDKPGAKASAAMVWSKSETLNE